MSTFSKNSNNQKPFITIYHDLKKCPLLTCYEKSVFTTLKMFADKNNQCFPSIQKLVEIEQLSRSTVQKALKNLAEKGFITIQKRKRADGGYSSNLYTLHEDAAESLTGKLAAKEEKTKSLQDISIEEIRKELERSRKETERLCKETERLCKELEKREAESNNKQDQNSKTEKKHSDTSVHNAVKTEQPKLTESVIEPVVEPVHISNDPVATKKQFRSAVNKKIEQIKTTLSTKKTSNTRTLKNRPQVKKPERKPQERYSMEFLKNFFEYWALTIDHPSQKEEIDSVLDILHTTMNTTKPTIRVAGEDKPTMVVISKFMKLNHESIIYAINKYKEQTERIRNPIAYMKTLLYNVPEQFDFDIQNQVSHDMAHWYERESPACNVPEQLDLDNQNQVSSNMAHWYERESPECDVPEQFDLDNQNQVSNNMAYWCKRESPALPAF